MRVRMIDRVSIKSPGGISSTFSLSRGRKTSQSSIWTRVGFFHVWEFPSDIETPFRSMTGCLAISDLYLANG